MKVSYQEKIIALWAAFLFGTLFHIQLGLMPLFQGLNIAPPTASGTANIAPILWLMLGFFVIPMFAIIITTFNDCKRYRIVHFALTLFYTWINFFHLILDLKVQPIAWVQIVLMLVLFGIGLLLNVVAWQWMKATQQNAGILHLEHRY